MKKYSKDHEWIIGPLINGNYLVGISDYATDQLGDIVYLDLLSDVEQLEQNEVFGSIEAVKTVSDIFAPVSCVVVNTNDEYINDNLDVLVDYRENENWIIEVTVKDESELDDLLSEEQYLKYTTG